jgi:hypothetical protein
MTENSLSTLFNRSDIRAIPQGALQRLQVASQAGAPIEYLGVQNLFDEIRVYRGVDRDWVLAPAQLDPTLSGDGRFPIPRANLDHLKRLVDAGLDFPVYLGHDVPPRTIEALRREGLGTGSDELALASGPVTITPNVAKLVVPTVPPPAGTVDWSSRYGAVSNVMLNVLAFISTAAIGIAAAPLFVVPSMFSAFASGFTDPVVFGASPLDGELASGHPAAWYALTSWSY